MDGRDCSGKYILASVMNARSLGPALTLAPEARCDDGELDVVLVGPESKHALVAHLRRAAAEGDIVLPVFETIRTRHVELRADGAWAHIDETARVLEGDVAIDAVAGAIKILAPPQSPARANTGTG